LVSLGGESLGGFQGVLGALKATEGGVEESAAATASVRGVFMMRS